MRRPLRTRDWWCVHHQLKTTSSLKSFSSYLISLHISHPVRITISQICRTSVSLWDLLDFGWIVICLSIFSHENGWFQCWRHEHYPYHRSFLTVFCIIHWRSFLLFLALVYSPYPRMIWILTTIPFLFRRLQWWIAGALLLFAGIQRLYPLYHPPIHQLSTLEKTKLLQRPILSSLLSACFQQIVCGGALTRDLRHGNQRVSPFCHTSRLARSKDFDFHNFSSAGFLMQKIRVEGVLVIKLIIGLDFTVTLSSLDSSCVLFHITSEQSVKLKWLMLNKHKRWFHSSRVKFLLVKMSASWFLVSMYLICILGSNLIWSNNQWSATLWVLGVSHCWTPSVNDHLDHCFIVFEHIQ